MGSTSDVHSQCPLYSPLENFYGTPSSYIDLREKNWEYVLVLVLVLVLSPLLLISSHRWGVGGGGLISIQYNLEKKKEKKKREKNLFQNLPTQNDPPHPPPPTLSKITIFE
jgi:hypothetical protein